MNVGCTACPAKYAVPDDRVRGKRARITCKHCGTAIIVDGTGLGPTTQPLKPEPGRQIRHTLVELPAPRTPSLVALASKSAPVAASRPPSPSLSGAAPRSAAVASGSPSGPGRESPASNAGAWLVALPDGRREPASLARIVDLFTSGTLDDSTYVWREGMPEWKPPRAIPEIARALAVRQSAPSASSAPFPRPGEYDEDEATRVGISLTDDSVLPPSSRPQPPANRGANNSVGPRSRAGEGSAPRQASTPAASRIPPRNEPPPGRSSLPGEDIVSRSRDAASLRKKSSPSASPPPPPQRDRALSIPGRTARRTLPPGAISIPLAGSDLMRRVPSAPTPAAPAVDVPSALANPPLRAPAEMDPAPRSAAPVALPLALRHDRVPRRKAHTSWLFGATAVLLLAVLALGFATKWKFVPPSLIARFDSSSAGANTPPVEPLSTPDVTAPPVASEREAPGAVVSELPSLEREAARPTSRPSQEGRAAAAIAPRAARTTLSAKNGKKPAPGEPASITLDEEPSAVGDNSTSDTKEGTDPAAPALGPPFDRGAAASALGDAATRAQVCAKPGGPTGTGSVTVTFSTNGQVASANVGGEYTGTGVGGCVVKLFRAAKIPAFGGHPIAVSKRFSIE